jgi:hypothetical protein
VQHRLQCAGNREDCQTRGVQDLDDGDRDAPNIVVQKEGEQRTREGDRRITPIEKCGWGRAPSKISRMIPPPKAVQKARTRMPMRSRFPLMAAMAPSTANTMVPAMSATKSKRAAPMVADGRSDVDTEFSLLVLKTLGSLPQARGRERCTLQDTEEPFCV